MLYEVIVWTVRHLQNKNTLIHEEVFLFLQIGTQNVRHRKPEAFLPEVILPSQR